MGNVRLVSILHRGRLGASGIVVAIGGFLMSIRSFRLLPAAGVTAALTLVFTGTGCHSGSFSFAYHDREPAKTHHVHTTHVIVDGDVHRYYSGGKVVVIKKGDRYGRAWNGERWILIRRPPYRRGVTHAWNGKHWVVAKKAPPPPVVVKTAPAKRKAKPYKPTPQPTRKKVKRVNP